MQRLQTGIWTLALSVALAGLSGCMATRKYVRNEVGASSDALGSRIDTAQGQIRENTDAINLTNEKVADVDQRVSGVDGKVGDLDARTTQSVAGLKNDVNDVNTRTDAAVRDLDQLDLKFQNRNNYAVVSQRTVLFGFDSAKLNAEGTAPLDEVAEMVRQSPDAILVLEGHTDSTGNREYNVKLGERRVEAVRRYLAVEKNVPVYKIQQISFGAERPVASNDSREGREQNRSVSLTILMPAMSETASAQNSAQLSDIAP